MIIKTWKLFTSEDSWPWLLVVAIPTFLAALAYRYSYLVTHEGISIAGQITLLSTLAAFYSIIIWRYILRYNFIKSIIGYSDDGVAVTVSGVCRTKLTELSNGGASILLAIVTSQTRNVLAFWNSWAVKNGKPQNTVSIFNGCTLDIEEQFLQTVGWSYKLAGLEIGGTIAIAWTTSNVQDIIPILRWETARHCLDAMGYSDSTELQQNAIMSSANFS
jgi:hypothetical protein